MSGPSPYVRRRWLGKEIRRLRDEHGYSSEQLARAVGFARQQLSALENGKRGPDIDLIEGICVYLQVSAKRRGAIMAAATDGWATGWWMADEARIGHRQARYADLESGTKAISEYRLALVPGLLQTADYADARMRSDPARQSEAFDPVAAVAARTRRQKLLLSDAGPAYDLVLDESAVRYRAAEPSVVADQLRHIVDLCVAHAGRISVRILPSHPNIISYSAPRSAYSIYRYADQQATQAVAVETLTMDLVLTEPDDVEAYRQLHSRLRAASLEPAESVRILTAVAEQISPSKGAR
ncbi:helix-turn-helix transcriptional regulator [Micromonospora sp. WMMD1082]|uniref:helix-turn-helix domain-containing protein n=1 Tax=Micromonospora sp. WMMD1082 TaxID=3016104 RepID=UPI002416B806|nr:helix-turn-helix transcriptional regulator [Micromonospora sp. WMMD1082]MDG4795501.1 helix-turn-helix transcriptional regulator [Micromonospora sp. WMMD1082]